MGPLQYLELLERLLDTCTFLEDRPHRPAPARLLEGDTRLIWKDTIRFKDDHELTAREHAIFDADGTWIARNFTYQFRKGNQLVFRLDTHGDVVDVEAPCHVHWGDEDRVIELRDPSPVDFSYAIRCICKYFSKKAQDWEVASE